MTDEADEAKEARKRDEARKEAAGEASFTDEGEVKPDEAGGSLGTKNQEPEAGGSTAKEECQVPQKIQDADQKQSMCWHWLAGKCKKANCAFAHGQYENGQLIDEPWCFKLTMCSFFLKQGICKKAGDCDFAHGEEDVGSLKPEKARNQAMKGKGKKGKESAGKGKKGQAAGDEGRQRSNSQRKGEKKRDRSDSSRRATGRNEGCSDSRRASGRPQRRRSRSQRPSDSWRKGENKRDRSDSRRASGKDEGRARLTARSRSPQACLGNLLWVSLHHSISSKIATPLSKFQYFLCCL